MRLIHRIVVAASVLTILAAGTAAGQPRVTVEPQLAAVMERDGRASYLVYLVEKADLSGAAAVADREAQGWTAYRALREVADRTQAPLLSYLAGELQSGRATRVKSFFSVNAIGVTSGSDTLAALAALPQVERIALAETYRIPEPAPGTAMPRVDAVEWNIARVRAPEVWARGIRGQGIVVANIDSGVQFTHPALVSQYRGNLGGSFDHNYNWWDPSRVCGTPVTAPCDNHGHGTHTMGTAVGGDGGANQIGVAPEAEWMACKGCETGSCSSFALLECGDFMLAPWDLNGANPDPGRRPHVVNNSWGSGPADAFYRPVVQAWRAAGIFPAFAAGNSGPFCGSASAPGNYPESFAAGATDSADNVASFSGRGPSAFGGVTKPDLSAPGVNVRSAVPNNSYTSLSGTSMASPHVAGIVALLWSEFGGLSRDVAATERKLRPATQIRETLQGCGGDGPRESPNNTFGSGRVDAFRAINAFAIYTNQFTYAGGDTLRVLVSFVNPDAVSLTGDLYLGVATATNVSLIPLGTQTLPPLLELFDAPVVNVPIPPGTAPGSFAWFALVVPPGADPASPANHISIDVASIRIQ